MKWEESMRRRLECVRQSLIDCERKMRRLPGCEDAKIHYRHYKAEEKSILKALGLDDEETKAKVRLRQEEMF